MGTVTRKAMGRWWGRRLRTGTVQMARTAARSRIRPSRNNWEFLELERLTRLCRVARRRHHYCDRRPSPGSSSSSIPPRSSTPSPGSAPSHVSIAASVETASAHQPTRHHGRHLVEKKSHNSCQLLGGADAEMDSGQKERRRGQPRRIRPGGGAALLNALDLAASRNLHRYNASVMIWGWLSSGPQKKNTRAMGGCHQQLIRSLVDAFLH